MADIVLDNTRIIGNVVRKIIESNSLTNSKIKFENDYGEGGNVFIKILDWPTKTIPKPLVISYPASFCRLINGGFVYSPFANIYFHLGSKGYPNAHVWGEDGRLCRGGVLIENPISLIECILDVILQKNTSKDSLLMGHPCPDSTLLVDCKDTGAQLDRAKEYQHIIKNTYCLSDDVFKKQEYFVADGTKKIKLGKYVEDKLSTYFNSIYKHN